MPHLLWFIAGAIVGGAVMLFALALVKTARRGDETLQEEEMARIEAMRKEQEDMRRNAYELYIHKGFYPDDKKN